MEAYKIGMSIMLSNGVSSVLATISRDILGVEGGIKRLQRAFDSLNKTSVIAGGAIAALAGGAMIGGVMKLADHAERLSHSLAQIKKLGLSERDFGAFRDAAYAAHKQVPGATSADALKTLGMTYSMFGTEGSIRALIPILQYEQAHGNTIGDYGRASEDVIKMIRAGELSGQFVDEKTKKVDVGKLTRFLSLGAKVETATHGMVGPDTWLNMAQMAGPMLGTMSDEGLLTMAMVGQAMKGHRAGTALQAVGRQFLGMKMTTPVAEELRQLGLMEGSPLTGKNGMVKTDKMGRVMYRETGLSTEGKAFATALQKDPMAAAGILLKTLNAHGFTTMDQIVPELYKIFGTDTARRLEHELVRNMPQMFDEKGRIKKGLSVSGALGVQENDDYTQIKHDYEAAKNEMMMHIGAGAMKAAIPVMKKMTEIFDKISEFAKTNPQAIENIAKGIMILGGALVAAGTVAILAALGPAGWIALGITALGGVVAVWGDKIKEFFNWFKTAIGNIIPSDQSIIDRALKLGAAISSVTHAIGDAYEWLKAKIDGLFNKTSYDGGGIGGGGIIKASYSVGGGGGNSYFTGLPSGTGSGSDIKRIIDGAATGAGIDPRIMYGIVAGESSHSNRYDWNGKGEDSWSMFQLNRHGGLGAIFEKETGLSVRDPKNIPAIAKWVAHWVASHRDLSPWRGFHGKRDWDDRWGNMGFSPSYVPPSGAANSNGHGNVYLDGHKVGKVMDHNLARRHAIPNSTNSHDGAAGYSPVDAVSI